MKICRKTSLLILLILLVTLFSACWLIPEKEGELDYISEITEYARNHKELTFAQFTDFEWDEAYQQQDPYNLANEVKEATGYEFEVERLPSDWWGRFLFFNHGTLVYEVTFDRAKFIFPEDIFVFYPDTVFIAEWVMKESMSGEMREYLQLRIKDDNAEII